METPAEKTIENINQELKSKSIQGSFFLLASQLLKFSIHIATAVILSRLLLPEDFGVFAIIWAVVSFILIFKDGGLMISAVQTQTLSEIQLHTLFWLNILLGFLLCLLTVGASWLTSQIYGDKRLFFAGTLLSMTFLFIGIGSQPTGVLRRKLEFSKLTLIETISIILGSLSGVLAAIQGAGFWSLPIVSLVMEFTQMVLVLLVSGLRPKAQFDIEQSRSLLSFGGYMTGFGIIGYLNLSFDNLLVGWFWGTTALGFYDKAYQILLVPLNQLNVPLSNVIHSTLSRLQNDSERFRQYFYRYVLLSTSVGMPLVGLIFGTIESLIPVALGEKWMPSVELFKALAPATFMMTISPCIGWLFISLGRAKRQIHWNSMMSFLGLVILIISLQKSVLTAAIAFSFFRSIILIPNLIFTCRNTPIYWLDVLITAARPALASFVALAVLLLIKFYYLQTSGHFLKIVFSGAVFFSIYVVVWLLLPNGLRLFKENLQLVKKAFRPSSD